MVGCQTGTATLWFLLVDCPGQKGAFAYDPVEYGETSWETAREVLIGSRVFLPHQVVVRQDHNQWGTGESHLLGIHTRADGFMRFAPVIDDVTFHRLTRYNGLPERWTAWHQGNPFAWRHALELPVITVGMWRRIHGGGEPEGEEALLLPQDPLPLMEHYRAYAQAVRRLRVIPSTIAEAKEYVRKFHRHNPAVAGGLFAVAVADLNGTVRGVAIVGRPIARALDAGMDGGRKRRIAEVIRLASDGTFDVCSMLYGAVRRMAKHAGFEKIVTYTQQREDGSSLRASGWTCVGEAGGRQWNCDARPRARKPVYEEPKFRWECTLNDPFPFESILFPASSDDATPFACYTV